MKTNGAEPTSSSTGSATVSGELQVLTKQLLAVSVVTPLRNEAQPLPLAISGLLQQTYAPAEVILIDGGSGDDRPLCCADGINRQKRDLQRSIEQRIRSDSRVAIQSIFRTQIDFVTGHAFVPLIFGCELFLNELSTGTAGIRAVVIGFRLGSCELC